MPALPDACYNHLNQMRGKNTGSSNSVSADISKEQIMQFKNSCVFVSSHNYLNMLRNEKKVPKT